MTVRRRASVLAVSLALATALSVPVQAGGDIRRLTQRADLFGWEAVGRVELGQGSFCTGVLIATDLVLTAAHCLFDSRHAPHAPGDIVFRAGLRDGATVAARNAAALVAHPRYVSADGVTLENARHDVGLIRLDRPIAAAVAAPFRVHEGADLGGVVSLVSYGRGRAEALSWHRDCRLQGRQRGVMAFDCNATFGSSGAPLFLRDEGRARILSLVSGGVTVAGRKLTLGMELPAAVAELKAALRRQAPAGPGRARLVRPGADRNASGARFVRP